eukprot:TRINITY_DN4380_c0_g1_i3.p1 TRINITY_DN4380_c0_g1~~TRINITY_DN4380_c0_g1_i3.p1  ORF type:complete len:854 (+),score=286.12 TRINITY_DN4380_c0_g1_i3:59-2563(+)
MAVAAASSPVDRSVEAMALFAARYAASRGGGGLGDSVEARFAATVSAELAVECDAQSAAHFAACYAEQRGGRGLADATEASFAVNTARTILRRLDLPPPRPPPQLGGGECGRRIGPGSVSTSLPSPHRVGPSSDVMKYDTVSSPGTAATKEEEEESRRPSVAEVSLSQLQEVCEKAVATLGYGEEDSRQLVQCMMAAQLRDNNQGIIKITTGGLNMQPDAGSPIVEHKTKLSLLINANRAQQMTVLCSGVDSASRMATEHGAGVVGIRGNPGSTGYLGYYAKRGAARGLVTIVMAQSPEFVAPHGSFEPIFGTNPIAFGVPRKGGSSPLTFDMATSAYALFGLLEAQTAGREIPEGVAYDAEGRPTKDPSAALKGAIRGFDGGHKSSGLALMVELLAGALTGAAVEGKKAARSWGNLVICLNPSLLGGAEALAGRVETVLRRMKGARRLPGVSEITLPGERGDRLAAERLKRGTISIERNLWGSLQRMAGPAKPELLVLWGTETGRSRRVAEVLHGEALQRGYAARCAPLNNYSQVNFIRARAVVIVCSTHGDGKPGIPQTATRFWVMLNSPGLGREVLSGMRVAVLGVGDTGYDNFCAAAKAVHARMGQLGAGDLLPLALADEDAGLKQTVDPWRARLWDALPLAFAGGSPRRQPAAAQPAPQPAVAQPAARPPLPPAKVSVALMYASQTGNAEAVAKDLHKELTGWGFQCGLGTLNDHERLRYTEAACAIFVVSTTGNADIPDNGRRFLRWLKRHPVDAASPLPPFTLVGLGDTSYVEFCGAAKLVQTSLAERGARTFYEPALADEMTGIEETIEPWRRGLQAAIARVIAAF